LGELSRASDSKGADQAKRGRPGGHWEVRAAVLLFPSRARVSFRPWSRGQACSEATLLEEDTAAAPFGDFNAFGSATKLSASLTGATHSIARSLLAIPCHFLLQQSLFS
jgi:hypothetical protein